MRKIIICLLSSFFLMAFFTSCEDEYGYPPEYGEVYCVNEHPCVGDTLILRVKILKAGNGSYKAEYTWRINGTSYTPAAVLDPFVSVPEFKYVAPEAGKYTISMSAMFNMSIATESGQIYSSASSKSGTVTVYARE